MENSGQSTFVDLFAEANKELIAAGFINAIKNPDPLKIAGLEEMSLGESISAFFKEFSMAADRKVARLSSSVHKVDTDALRKAINNRKILFVKNTGVDIVVPANYTPGIASMMSHTKGVVDGVYLLSSLKTEAARLYDWLKQIVKTGRPDTTFRWSISSFDAAIDKADHFVMNLPDENRRNKCPLGQVYVNFEEMFDVLDTFNTVTKQLGARDVELVAKELEQAYSMGQLLVEKIKNNDLTFDKSVIFNIETTINSFVKLTNLCGAMITLLNELSAVLREQIKEVVTL